MCRANLLHDTVCSVSNPDQAEVAGSVIGESAAHISRRTPLVS
jgi:hypothetical protein